jgi:light-regulated signal transduction histidine kinase (bacteriophytochrome)
MNMHDTTDLTNCDVEPIHIPGSIQPHGCLLACDATAGSILRHSANSHALLGIEGELNGNNLSDVIGRTLAHEIRNALSRAQDGGRSALLFGQALANGRHFDVAVHRYKGYAIIELEPTESDIAQPLELSRTMLNRISKLATTEQLISGAVRLIQAMLDYDRVMIYQFGADGAGKVCGEAKRPHLESFFGQYFPATDIPKQARALYLKNPIRIISDANCERVQIVPVLDASGEPLDLSFAHLRSVSPIHCEYLRNMGVRASMSISIIVDGELWGLIACHHYEPRTLSMAQRVAAEIFGEFFSLHLNALNHKQTLDAATTARTALDNLLQAAVKVEDINELLGNSLSDFAKLIPADGLAITLQGKVTVLGTTPAEDDIKSLARFATNVTDGKTWATNKLSNFIEDAERYADRAAGMLVIPLSQRPRDYIFFFRKELVQTLNWAGNPEKSYETGPFGDRLTPRKSFAIWKQTVHLQSEPWTEKERQFGEAARTAMVSVILEHSELLADERAKSAVRQRMLNQELTHRVKNILAIIKSLVTNPASQNTTLENYVEALRGRIQALSFAHDQVVRGEGGGSLQELLDAELSPYRTDMNAIELKGPNVWMDARSFSIMALVFHELSTNAAKYGSLSRQGGKLSVSWSVDPFGACDILWSESNGPVVHAPSRQGFGTVLIDRSIPFDLGGESNVEYKPEGISASFRIPARFVSTRAERKTQAAVNAAAPEVPSVDRGGKKVMIVEDQMLIALELEQILQEAGLEVVATLTSSQQSIGYLADGPLPDLAILDVNLGDTTSEPIAHVLTQKGVPFMFATGYDNGNDVPAAFSDVPVVRKPYSGETIVRQLDRLLQLK